MKLLRRLVGVLRTGMLIAVLGYSAYMIATGQIPAEKRLTMIGGGTLIGAILLFGVFAKCRRKNHLSPKLIDDPRSVIEIGSAPMDSRVLAATLAVAAVGCGTAILGGGLDMSSQVLMWLGIVVFGGVALWLITKHPVSLRLSPDGLDYTGFKTGQIAWGDIRSATLRTIGRVQCIVLGVSNEQTYLARRPKAVWHFFERLISFPPFAFAPPAFGVSPESIVRAIEIRLAAFGHTSPGRVIQE